VRVASGAVPLSSPAGEWAPFAPNGAGERCSPVFYMLCVCAFARPLSKSYNVHYDNRQKVAVKCSLCAPRRNSDGVVDPGVARWAKRGPIFPRPVSSWPDGNQDAVQAPRATSGGLFPLGRCARKGPPMCFPEALARLPPSAVRMLIRSRSTSESPSGTGSIKRPVPVSANGSARIRNRTFASVARQTAPARCPVLRKT
jgi:hypothetical protein